MNDITNSIDIIGLLKSLKTKDELWIAADSLKHFIQHNENKIAELKSQAATIKNQIKEIEAVQEFIANKLMNFMNSIGASKVDCTDNSSIHVSARDIIIVDEDTKLPDNLLRIKKEPDKRALMKFYKDTQILPPGCSIQTNYTLSIKEKKNKEA